MSNLGYRENDGVLVQGRLAEDSPTLWTKSIFRARSEIPYTTTWCEHQMGEVLLDKALSHIALTDGVIFGDLGCGDGRFVRSLLERGANRIIALNYEIEPLRSLQYSLSEEEHDRVALICADINESPLKGNTLDFSVAWGLWSSTDDFRKALNSTSRLTRNAGLILNAEPVLEHALTYALVMQDHREFERILQTGSRPLSWDDRERRYPLKTVKELDEIMMKSELDVIWRGGVSVLPSLLFGGLLTTTDLDNQTKHQLWESLSREFDNLSWYRQVVYLSTSRS